jgi:hypothetical protein
VVSQLLYPRSSGSAAPFGCAQGRLSAPRQRRFSYYRGIQPTAPRWAESPNLQGQPGRWPKGQLFHRRLEGNSASAAPHHRSEVTAMKSDRGIMSGKIQSGATRAHDAEPNPPKANPEQTLSLKKEKRPCTTNLESPVSESVSVL